MTEEYASPEFVALVDAIHDASIQHFGCNHPRWKPAECTLVARHLWDIGMRFTYIPCDDCGRKDGTHDLEVEH